jgi:transposase
MAKRSARKLAVLFWCMLTRSEDHAHQQPSLTREQLRRLEITAGAAKNTRRAARIWSTNDLMCVAERDLAEQAEASYMQLVQDQLAAGPSKKVGALLGVRPILRQVQQGQAGPVGVR